MFEKEAEETVKRNVCGDCNKCQSHGYIGCEVYRYSRDSYLRGAEFGYNKANEWHYPSKGEYPKDKSKVLCIISELEDSYCEIGYYSQVETQTYRWNFGDYCMKDKSEEEWGVIAWKEIVLPELKEIE